MTISPAMVMNDWSARALQMQMKLSISGKQREKTSCNVSRMARDQGRTRERKNPTEHGDNMILMKTVINGRDIPSEMHKRHELDICPNYRARKLWCDALSGDVIGSGTCRYRMFPSSSTAAKSFHRRSGSLMVIVECSKWNLLKFIEYRELE